MCDAGGAEPWTPVLARHMLSSLKPSENSCVPCWPPLSQNLNLKCISECCSTFSNLVWSTDTRNLSMLQTRENGKENIATSCLKESPVYALPCFCKWALRCMLRMGKGHKKNVESPSVWYCSQNSWGIKKYRRDTYSLLRRYLWKGLIRNIFREIK